MTVVTPELYSTDCRLSVRPMIENGGIVTLGTKIAVCDVEHVANEWIFVEYLYCPECDCKLQRTEESL